MSSYRNYYPWKTSYSTYSPLSTYSSNRSRLSTSRDDTIGDSKTSKYGSLTASNYRPTFSSTSGTYRTPRSASLTTYTSRYGTSSAATANDKEKPKEKEGTPPKKTTPVATSSSTSRYSTNTTPAASKDTSTSVASELRSRYANYAPKPKKDEGPPVTFTTRYGKASNVSSRTKSRDPSPAAHESKRSLLNTSSASLRARSRDPSPAEPKRTYGSSLSMRDRSRDPSPAASRLNTTTTTIPRRLSVGEKSTILSDTKRTASTYGRSLTTRDSKDTEDKGKVNSYLRKPSRDSSPTEMQKLINQYATTLNISDKNRSRDPSPVRTKQPAITVSRIKAREPSPALRMKSRDTSPVNSYLSMRRASREPSPAENLKTSRYGSSSTGFTPSTYNRYSRNNSNSSLSKYGSSSATSRNPVPDQCLSYMTASESRAVISKKPKSDRSSRSSQSSKSEEITKPDYQSRSVKQAEVERKEQEKVEPKIMVQVHVVTRATSPTPPGSTSYVRARRAEVAKTIEKTIQRQLNVGKMVDKEIQSDRMDDSTKYSRFNSARNTSTPWSYADLKYSPSPTGSYSRYSSVGSRYSREPSVTSTKSDKEKSVSSSSDYDRKDEKPITTRSKESSPLNSVKPNGTNKSTPTKTSSSKSSSSSSKEKSRSPVKQKSPDRPPPVPKAESPTKTISSSTSSNSANAKWANKDFRKSVLNIGPTDRTRKSSTTSSVSTPEEEQTESKINQLYSNHEHSQSKSPVRQAERERTVSESSEASETSSLTSEVESQNVKTKASSRTSLLASSDDDLPFDKTTNEARQSREKSAGEPKSFLVRAFGPITKIIKAKITHSSADKSWLDNSSATNVTDDMQVDQEPLRLGSVDQEDRTESEKAIQYPYRLRHIDSGDRPWWLESENNSENARKSSSKSKPSSPIKSPPISSPKSTENEAQELAFDDDELEDQVSPINENHSESGEKNWWLGELTPSDLSEKSKSKSKSEFSKHSQNSNAPPVFTNQYKIRPIQSGDRAWWLASDASADKSSSKSLSGQWWTTQPNFQTIEDTEVSTDQQNGGLQKFPNSFNEHDSPLGARASPEGVEAPSNDRKSPYDNVLATNDHDNATEKNKKLFISRHTNIDDVLGCSHPISPLIDRVFSMGEFQEIQPSQVIIHDSSPQKSIMQRTTFRFQQEDESKMKMLDDAALQVYKDGDYGTYLDLESSVAEQVEDIEGLQSSRKNSLVIRTQLSVRVHSIIEKLLTCEGRDLRRSLFSLKQIFQEDKDLVHGFVALGGLNCLVQIGSGADQNYQNYILRALGQVMLYVDGMNGVMQHGPTIQWLYSLIASKYRLVVKTALKLLLVFVEYCEGNCYLLVNAIRIVDTARGILPWSNIMKLLKDYENADTELLIYATSLINKTLSGLSDQDNFYDESDYLEQQGMEGIVQRYMSRPGTDLDLLDQLQLYEAVLRFEDGEIDGLRIPDNTVRKTLRYRTTGSDTVERRKSKRHSTSSSPSVPPPPVPPLPPQYSSTQAVDEDSSSSANSGDLNGVFRECRENGPREGAGVTPGLRRRRERAERQKTFMREQQELINGNVEEENNGRARADNLLSNHTKNGNSSPSVCVNGSNNNNINTCTNNKPYFMINNNNKLNGNSNHYNGTTKSVISNADDASSKQMNGISNKLEYNKNQRNLSGQSGISGYSPTNGHVENELNGNTINSNGYHQKFEKIMNSINYQDKQINGTNYYSHIKNGYNYTNNLLPKSPVNGMEKSYYSKPSSTHSNSSTTGSIVSIDSGIGSVNGHSNYSSLETIPATTPPAILGSDLDGNGNAIDMGQEEKLEVESENEDKNIILQLKREQTVKDLTQKLSNLPLSPSQDDKPTPRIVGEMSGLITKAKEGLAKSKSKGDISRSPSHEHDLKPTPKVNEPKKSENEVHWEELVKNMSRQLTLCDLDFTDLTVDDEKDLLAPRGLGGSIPPPPPPCGMMAPPPLNMFPPPPTNLVPFPSYKTMNGDTLKTNGDVNGSTIQKNKKTVKLFWKEVREDMIPAIAGRTVWDELPALEVDTQKLEHLFESRAKDLMTKKQQELNKNKEIIVLDHKRSNAINIAITKLPPPRAIKAAILKMDQTVVTREGIEKLMNMLPTDEERCKIQEAQMVNPELPLGSAEQFLLTLSSISELAARLKLWAFKLDFENIEKEIAEPLMDLKQGLELLKANPTFKCILSTLLSIGIFLNGAPVKGFQVEYLAKVPEVKDTVHKHSLLHHLCHMVMESSPNTTDLYSEIGPITRASKADFTDLAHNIAYLETECKASWDRLKLISKHDTAPQLKQKLVDFLADCAERIIILDIVHRRVINRFRKFLLWLGIPQHRIAESRPNDFCRIISEFALEYRTTRERVQQQIEKKANHRERNKTRGKMIIDITKLKTKEDTADAELRQLLDSPTTGKENGEVNGFQTWRRRRGDNLRSPGVNHHNRDESFTDGDDELLETLVKTATKAATPRAMPRERKRTRHADRKSLRRTLKTGLNEEEKQQVASYIKGY